MVTRDGADVDDKVFRLDADGSESIFAAVPAEGWEVSALSATAADGTTAEVDQENCTVTLSHNKVWTIQADFVKSAAKRIVTLNITGSGTVDGQKSGTALTKACDEITLEVMPAGGSAVYSVKLGEEDLSVVDGKVTLPAVPDDNGDVRQTLTVIFKEKTLVPKEVSRSYEYTYGQSAVDVIGDPLEFAKILVNDMVDLTDSFPALSVEDVAVEYVAAGQKDAPVLGDTRQWKPLNHVPGILEHAFGEQASETIRFTANGKTLEAEVDFAEKPRLESSIDVVQPLMMTYTTDATKIADVLYENILDTSVLPNGLRQDDFEYFYQCNISDILLTTIGTPIPDKIMLPIVGEVDLPRELMNVWVNTDDPATIGEALAKLTVDLPVIGETPLDQAIIELLKIDESVLSQPITPCAGENRGVKVTWGGNSEYQSSEWIGTITITKAPCTLSTKTLTVTYGDDIPTLVTTTPENVNKLAIYVGIDAKNLTFASVSFPKGVLYDAVEALFPDGFTLADISKVLEMIGQTVDNEALNQILAVIPDTVKNATVYLGQKPSNAGVYLVCGVTVDPNYETAYDIGLLTILPQTGTLEVRFNQDIPGTIPQAKLGNYNFNGYVADAATGVPLEGMIPNSLIVGVTSDGQVISTTSIDSIASLAPGVYSQILYVDDVNRLVKPETRVFTVLSRESARITVNDKTTTYGTPIPEDLVVTDPEGLGHIEFYAGVTAAVEGAIRIDGEGEYWKRIEESYPDGFVLGDLCDVIEAAELPFAAEAVKQIWSFLPDGILESVNVECGEPTNAGVYTVISVLSDSKYYPDVDAGLLSIRLGDANNTVEFDQLEYVYNGQPQAPTATIVDGSGNKVDGVNIRYDFWEKTESFGILYWKHLSGKPTEAGEYGITVLGWDFNNLPANTKQTFKIVPAELTITVDDAVKCVNAKDPDFKYIVEYLNLEPEAVYFDLDVTPSRENGEMAGDYKITATVPASKNYNVTVIDGMLTISEHDYESGVTAPTCTEKGYTTHTCSRCGDSYTDSAVPAKGHSWNEGKVTSEPTCTTEGVRTYICQNDSNHVRNEKIAIDPNAHAWGEWSEWKYVSGRNQERSRVCELCKIEEKDTRTISDGSGSSGGGSASTYVITVESAENGAVTADHKSASRGTSITLTVDPDNGYQLESIIVTDKNGDKLKLTENNGKYTFTMPASKVTVKAAFMKENSATVVFDDVAADAYYYDAVIWAAMNGITGGTSATTFDPNAICTRAQAVTFLWRIAGSPVMKDRVMPFEDVDVGAYYYDAVLWAVEMGITKGTSDTSFGPDEKCTRAQIVAFLWRAQKETASVTENPFVDVAANFYYTTAVLWAVENGITNGTTATTFSPDASCTRAQIVTFLYRSEM